MRPDEDVPEDLWHIGIRIEDDALVMPDGNEILSRGVPMTVGEIDALTCDANAATRSKRRRDR